jgi:hypothetical protein
MNTLELDTRLNALLIERKSREAFLEYYDENVVAQENEGCGARDVEGMGAIHTIQVAVRRWKNGRVVRERFYHK